MGNIDELWGAASFCGRRKESPREPLLRVKALAVSGPTGALLREAAHTLKTARDKAEVYSEVIGHFIYSKGTC